MNYTPSREPIQKVSQTADFYQALVTHSTELISVVDQEGVYTYVGDSLKSQLGYEVSDLLGKAAIQFFHPDDAAAVAEALGAIQHLPRVEMKPFRFKTKSGEWRWLQCSVTNMLQNEHVRGLVTNSRDITDFIAAEQRKEYHLAHYKSMFYGHPEAAFTLDTDGNLTQTNSHVSGLTGYTEDELVGLHYTTLTNAGHREAANIAFRKALDGEAQYLELPVLDKAGQEKHLFLTLIPVHVDEQIACIQGIAQDITAAKQSQHLLQEQARQLHNIVESIPDPFIVLDADWRFEYVNKAFTDFMGFRREVILGQKVWDLLPEIMHTTLYQKAHEVATNRTIVKFEESYVGQSFETLKYSVFPADNGIAVHFVDYTSQRSTQRELEKLSLVASKTINGVIIMNALGRIEWVNDGFCRITGYTRNEVLGQIPSNLLQGPESDPAASQRIREKYQSLLPFSEEILNYKKNGEKLWFAIDVTPIFDAEGHLINYIAIETDITEKKEDEVKLTKLADDLLKHNRNLKQFAYLVSHNLRAPVANAMGLASLLHKLDKHSTTYDKTTEKLQTSLHQLDAVIKDIGSILSTREVGGTAMRQQVNFREICQEVRQSFEEQLQDVGAEVTLEIDPAFQILTIRAYLYSILHNLFSNAIKFRDAERPLALSLQVSKDKRGYLVTFTDNGLGMDMHLVENQLFKLYNRFHPDIQGKGMGLYLVKTQVETIGGKIQVSSAPGEGTTFRLLLGSKHV